MEPRPAHCCGKCEAEQHRIKENEPRDCRIGVLK
jgi:hypothetical protein